VKIVGRGEDKRWMLQANWFLEMWGGVGSYVKYFEDVYHQLF
jgi:hypothetical protein